MKQIRRDDSDGSSGVASVDVGDSRLLLREVGADGKIPKDGAGWSMEGDGGERGVALTRGQGKKSQQAVRLFFLNSVNKQLLECILSSNATYAPAVTHSAAAHVVERRRYLTCVSE